MFASTFPEGAIFVHPPATVFPSTSKVLQPVGVDGVVPAPAVAVAIIALKNPVIPLFVELQVNRVNI